MKHRGIRSILINSGYLTSAKMIASAGRAVYAVLLAKFLGAELYGVFNYAVSWYSLFLPLAVLGLNIVVLRGIGLDRGVASKLIGQTLILRTVSGLAVAAACFGLAIAFESDTTTRDLILIFSIALVGRNLALWSNSVLTAHEVGNWVFQLEVTFRLLEIAVGLMLLFMGAGVIELAWVHAITWLAQGTIGLTLILGKLRDVRCDLDLGSAYRLVRTGFPFVIATLLLNWLLLGPLVMFRHVEGISSELGQLAFSLQALLILGLVVSEASAAVLPVLSRSAARKDGKSDKFLSVVLRGGLLLGGLTVIAAAALGKWFADNVLGSNYALTASLLPWTLSLVIPYIWATMLSNVLVAHGSYWPVAMCNLTGALVFTLSAIFLISEYGSFGVLGSLGAGFLFLNIAQLTVLRRFSKMELAKSIGRPSVAVGLGMLITLAVNPANVWLSFILGSAGMAIFSLLMGVVEKDEIAFAKQWLLSATRRSK